MYYVLYLSKVTQGITDFKSNSSIAGRRETGCGGCARETRNMYDTKVNPTSTTTTTTATASPEQTRDTSLGDDACAVAVAVAPVAPPAPRDHPVPAAAPREPWLRCQPACGPWAACGCC